MRAGWYVHAYVIVFGPIKVDLLTPILILFTSILRKADVVGAVGKVSAFRPQGPQFDPRLCQDSKICAIFFSA